MSLARSFAATASTTILNSKCLSLIQFYLFISHKCFSQINTIYIQIVTGKQLLIWKNTLNQNKTAGEILLQLLLQVQKRCNSSVIPIFTQFVITQLCHFTNQAQGDRRWFFTQKLILNNQTWNNLEINQMPKYYHWNYTENKLVIVTNDLRYQRDPWIVKHPLKCEFANVEV